MVNCDCGQRVAVDRCRGTVRYLGPVADTKGTWLGVEWDDPARGKHDGTHLGVRYFHTSHPTSGSFIHIEKADFGRSCVSAIKERYGSNQLTLTVEELKDLQRAMNTPHLEMVGFDKINQQQSCFWTLRVVCLHEQQVCRAGEGLADLCPDTRDLDLSSNLLASWRDVADIAACFPHLQLLNLSDNRLEIPGDPASLSIAFQNLSHLVLAHLNYTWEDICACCTMWPQIQNLQVPFNNITNLCLPENALVNLTHLDLEGNSIPQWEEINKLGTLEKLESLNLCDLGLTNICLPASKNLFRNLQCLLLSENKISKWEYVAELDKLSRLEELRFTHNPVQDNLTVDTIYYKTITRIGSLKVLNRTHITREERRGAEMDYLKENGMEWLEASKDDALRLKFLNQHPRFPLLIKKHGAAEESEMEVKSTSLMSSLVRIRLRGRDKCVTKTLPRTMLLTRIISLLQRLFNTGSAQPTLRYRSAKNPDVEVEMDNLLKSLDFYSVEDDDEISVSW